MIRINEHQTVFSQNIHTVPPDRGSYIISQGRVIMFRILGRAGDHEDASNLDLLES